MSLSESSWNNLLESIANKECTPFLGAGACVPTLPLGGQIAQEWAKTNKFPIEEESSNLPRVAQFIRVNGNDMRPRRLLVARLQKAIREIGNPDFAKSTEIHGVLARLELPLYLTTNYDDFMTAALKPKTALRDFCRWNDELKHLDQPPAHPANLVKGFRPSSETPLVYHLHGIDTVPESLVVAEDDYFDFMVNMGPDTLPPTVQSALATNSLLFVGYALADWNFRVIFRSLRRYIDRDRQPQHVSIQFLTTEHKKNESDVKAYFQKHFAAMKIDLFFGNSAEFSQELETRWNAYRAENMPEVAAAK